jgi:hypothetical protein
MIAGRTLGVDGAHRGALDARVDPATLARLLGEIDREGQQRSERERANLARDLGAIVLRLRAGEYATTDFIAPNVFDVARRTHEFFEYMRGIDRVAWRAAELIRPVLSSDVREVIDLCPGRIPKVEMALMRLGFEGIVTLVDKDEEAVAELESLVAMFAPRFSMRMHTEDIFGRADHPSADLVIANHVLDDALVDRYAARLGLDPTGFYEDEAELRRSWALIMGARAEILGDFPATFARAVERFVRSGGRLLLTHYQSYVETLLGGAEVSTFFGQLFEETVAELARGPFEKVAGGELEGARGVGEGPAFGRDRAHAILVRRGP